MIYPTNENERLMPPPSDLTFMPPKSDFEFFDPINAKGRFSTDGNHIRIGKFASKGGWRISFGPAIKERIEEKGCQHIRFCENKLTGELYVVFVKDPSYLKVNIDNRAHGYSTNSPFIYSKQAYCWLKEKLGLSDEELSATFCLGEDLSRTNEQITYKIGKRL